MSQEINVTSRFQHIIVEPVSNSVSVINAGPPGSGGISEGIALANLIEHLSDTEDAHDAAAISVVPSASIISTNVQAALEELALDLGTPGAPGIEVVDVLPTLPNPAYPEGTVVYLSTDGNLYTSTGTTWERTVPDVEEVGLIGGGNALTNSSFENTVNYLDDWFTFPDDVTWVLETTDIFLPAQCVKGTVIDATFSGNRDNYGRVHHDEVISKGYDGPWVLSAWIKAPVGRQIGISAWRGYDVGGLVKYPWDSGYPGDATPSMTFNVMATGLWQRVSEVIVADTSSSPIWGFFIRVGVGSDGTGWVNGDVIRIDAVQMEMGEVLTAYVPKPGEILPLTITNSQIVDLIGTKIQVDTITATQIAPLTIGSSEIADLAVLSGKIADNAIITQKLANNQITTAKIVDDAINAAKLADAAVATINIQDGAVLGTKIADNQITNTKIVNAAIDAAKLATDAVTTIKIQDGAVLGTKISDNAITTAKIVDDAITAAELADAAVATAHIQTGAITTDRIADLQITNAKIVNDAIDAAKLATNAVDTMAIQDGAVLAAKIADNQITTAKIVDDAITAAELADLAVANAHIQTGAITTIKIADGAVNNAKIVDDAINAAKIAPGAVGTTELVDGSVVTAKIGALAVTEAELASNSVTNAKIVDDAITAAEIAAGAVGTTEIANLAVVTSKIGPLAVTQAELAANAVTNAKIVDDAVNAAKIATAAVGSNELAAGSVIAGKIAAGTIVSGDIAAGTITGGNIAGDTIQASNIAAGAITTSELAAGAVTAGNIAAGSVTTEKLTVAGLSADSVLINGGFEELQTLPGEVTMAAHWIRSQGSVAQCYVDTAVPGGANTGKNVLRLIPGAGLSAVAYSDNIPVSPGEQWYFTFKMKTIGTNAGTSPGTYVRANGGATSSTHTDINSSMLESGTVPATWTKYEYVVTVPAGYQWMGIIFYNWTENTGASLLVDSVEMKKLVVSAVIANGAITAGKLAAGSVQAGNIAAGAIVAGDIAADTIQASNIAAGAIGASELAAGAVTAGKIAAGTIQAVDIAANVITSNEIAANAIGTSELAAGAVIAGKIAAGTIVAADIAADTITGAQIAANAITTVELAANAVIAENILGGEIVAGKLAAGAVQAGNIAAGAVVAGNLAAGAIVAGSIAADAITSVELAANAVAAENILAGAVQAGKIAAGAVQAGNIAAGAIVAGDIAADTITGAQIAANAITTVELAANAVIAENILGGEVVAGKLAAGAVQAGNIAAGAVTAGTIAAGAIVANDIAADTITGAKIAADTITTSELATNAVIAENILAGAVQAGKIAAGAVQAGNIAAGAVQAGNISAGAIVAGDIAANTITGAQIAADAISTSELAANAVIAENILAGEVVAGKLAVSAVQAGNIAAGAVQAGNIAALAVQAGNIAALAIQAGDISAGAITSAKIASGAVTTEKLTVAGLGDTMVLNPGFEEVTTADVTLPSHWVRFNDWGGTSTSTNAFSDSPVVGQIHGGARVLRLIPGAGQSSAMMGESVPAAVGEVWYLSFWARSQGTNAGTSPGFFAGLYQGSTSVLKETTPDVGANPSLWSGNGIIVPTAWTKYETQVTVQSGRFWIRPAFLNYTTNTGCSFLVDDVVLQKVIASAVIADGAITTNKIVAGGINASAITAGTITTDRMAINSIDADRLLANSITSGKLAAGSVTTEKLTVGSVSDSIVPNSSFEDAKQSDSTMAANWNRESSTDATETAVDNTNQLTGSKCLRVVAGAGDSADVTSDWMPCAAGETWYLSFWCKSGGANAGTSPGMYYGMESNNTLPSGAWSYNGNPWNNHIVPTTWTKYETQLIVPVGSYQFRVHLLQHTTNTGCTLFFDSFELRKVTVSAVIADGAITTNKIGANQVVANHIAADQITSTHIQSGTILAGDIAADQITSNHIVGGTIQAGDIGADQINANHLQAIALGVNKYIRSTVYTPGSVGWSIEASGNAEFNNITMRGVMQGGGIDWSTNGGSETAPSATNIFINGTFDTDTTGWTAGANTTISRQTDTPQAGLGYLRLASNAAGTISATTATGTSGMPILPHREYVVTFYVKRNSATDRPTSTFGVQLYNSAGLSITGGVYRGLGASFTVNATWTQYTVYFAAPHGAAFASFQYQIPGTAAANEFMCLDTCTLREQVVGWDVYNIYGNDPTTGPGIVLTRDTGTKLTGAASLKVTTTAFADVYEIGTYAPVVPNNAYRWSFSVLRGAGTDVKFAETLTVEWLDANGNVVDFAESGLSYTARSTWLKVQYTVHCPDNASIVYVRFAMSNITSTASSNISWYVDDSVIEQVPFIDEGYLSGSVIESLTSVFDAFGYVMPPGSLIPWAGLMTSGSVFDLGGVGPAGGEEITGTPAGWIPCDGRAMSRTIWWRLFSVVGTTYGAGDGSTTFNVPDLRGRSVFGLDNLGGSDAGRLNVPNTLGGNGGGQTHTLTTSEMPGHSHSHSHSLNMYSGYQTGISATSGPDGFTLGGNFSGTTGVSTDATPTGGGQAHNNMPPYILINWIIKG